MIKFSGQHGKHRMIGIGLSRENCERLLAGKPIVIWAREVNLEAVEEIFIMAGETEQSMFDELNKLGALGGVPIHQYREKQ